MMKTQLIAVLAAISLASCSPPQGVASSAPIPVAGNAASHDPLLYAVQYDNAIDVYKFPRSAAVQHIEPVGSAYGVCQGMNDDVWVAGSSFYPNISEYFRGQTKPAVVMNAPGSDVAAVDCAVDPGAKKLAVVESWYGGRDPANVVIFADPPKNPPVAYQPVRNATFAACAYDSFGNLFVAGAIYETTFFMIEMKKGSKKFSTISLDRQVGPFGGLRWDGTHLVLGDGSSTSVYRLAISGTHAKVVGTTTLSDSDTTNYGFAIYDGTIVGRPPRDSKKTLGYWNYPAGGDPVGEYGKILYASFAVMQ
jgi:hypothetical protein